MNKDKEKDEKEGKRRKETEEVNDKENEEDQCHGRRKNENMMIKKTGKKKSGRWLSLYEISSQ